MTDIFVITHNRLDNTRRTLGYLKRCTISPYRLIVIDNASDHETLRYLKRQHREGVIDALIRNSNIGLKGALDQALNLSTTDPYITLDNDILVPDLVPDWLRQALLIFTQQQDVWMAALNHFCARERHKIKEVNGITLCNNIGNTVRLYKKDVFLKNGLRWNKINHPSESESILSQIRSVGGNVGYFTNIYCKHIGLQEFTIRPSRNDFRHKMVDPKTFVPLLKALQQGDK
jgi:hypothetical protein